MMMPETPPPIKPAPNERPVRTRKRTNRRSVFGFFLTILVTVWVALTVFVRYIGTRDLESPPDDSFIQSHATDVPDDQNAYEFYLDAVVATSLLREEHEELIAAENNEVGYEELRERIIVNNASALSLIESAANAPLSQAPSMRTFEDESEVDTGTLRWLYAVLSIYHRTILERGREREAMDYSMCLAELGSRLTASNPATIDYLHAVAIERVALHAFRESLNTRSYGTDELLGYIDRLSKLRDDGTVLSQTLSEEYFLWNRTIAGFFSGKIRTGESTLDEILKQLPQHPKSLDYYYHPHRTRALILELFQPLIEDAHLPYSEMRLRPMHAVPALSLPTSITKLTPNGVSEVMIQIIYPGLLRTSEVKCRLNSEIAACQTLVALKCYQNDNGTSAENLEDLVPRYLPNLPLDDYNGAPLLYDSERRILYSVGKDLVDDGGDESADFVWAISGATGLSP